ncbi:MAG: Acetolactate synthase large subunit homolog [uncultured Thermomicrobiales bacterium]|uniref:Acetolactate synthase large subunit homolog n=1 Tax=uncultured Thermomicrobiales bacterium TaxID=1645740 RepID=A0A6J4VYY7_9BACT|nr:MAG: Acetolactate synthase large subunit homolog [uncultured Thermomicrobiales bacterium]
MNGTQVVARILQQEGVEVLFSYPNNPIIDAAAALGIRPIIARTEKTLINMADGYSRATNGRRLGVCAVQSGPGIENAFGGVAQAYADSIPILLLPGGPDQRRLGVPGEFDPLPTYRNVTKWAARINYADRAPAMLRRAFTQLRTGPSGPVLLEVPRDVMQAQVDEASFSYTPARGYRSAGDPADVAEAARLLLAASRPVFHVGHGVLWAEATDELRELAELVQVPVMTTMAGKSAFPENHPLALGAGGHTLARAAGHFLARADLVFGIGSSFAMGSFSAPIPPGKTIVQVTLDGRDVERDYPIDLAVVGDAKLVLRQLIDEVKRQGGGGAGGAQIDLAGTIREVREAERQEWLPRLTSDETPINPYRVIWELMRGVDRGETIVTHDSGNPRDQTLTFYEALAPRGYLGWGKSTQLGTGLGIALGAKLAMPEKLVINIMGDLAFGTAATEVETAVRERIPILTILLNNSRMGGYGGHMPTASERFGANRLSGRYAGVAAELGAYSERVEAPGEVAAAIERAVAATREGRPAVLEMITKEEPVYPAARAVLDAVQEPALA